MTDLDPTQASAGALRQEGVCSLDEDALRDRAAMIRREILVHVARSERLPDGVLLEFAAAPGLEAKLEEMVALERKCCSSLSWALQGGDSPRLRIGGVDPGSAFFAQLGVEEPLKDDARGPLGRLAKAGGLAAGLSFVLFCVVPIGLAAVVGASAAPLLALDDPRVVIGGAVALALPAWWLVRRRELRAKAQAAGGCGGGC